MKDIADALVFAAIGWFLRLRERYTSKEKDQ